jgi:lysophospholipase L1-like esterase
LSLLTRGAGKPLMDLESISIHLTTLLRRLRELNTRLVLLGLLPVDEARFPGSPASFDSVNARLLEIATAEGVDFLDWGAELKSKAAQGEFFYRDGFHPNLAGARALAEILRSRLCPRK